VEIPLDLAAFRLTVGQRERIPHQELVVAW